jgi:nucleotide-binding universal stress UspA family protein
LAKAHGDVECVAETRIGFAAEMTLEYASEHDIDAIVMATAGRTGITRLMIGSVTESVMRKATCPVISIRHVKRPAAVTPGQSNR